jgi:hypothetical protein
MVFRLHPALRGAALYRRYKTLAGLGVLAAVVGGLAWHSRQGLANADYVLDLDLPRVPIYYKNELLGHTPLAITPELVRDHHLPLDPALPLKLVSPGWADCEELTDGKTTVPLYAGPAWPFGGKLEIFPTPWGERARMSVGMEKGKLRSGLLYPRAELREEPVMTIEAMDAWPLAAGAPLRLHCVLTNPTAKDYKGRQAVVGRRCYGFEARPLAGAATTGPVRREVTMPASWNALPAGGKLEGDVKFEAPGAAGDYELFCTWFLYKAAAGSNEGAGSVYSNILWLRVK